MSEKERPLPRPPKRPFGRRSFEEGEENAPLMADKIAEAMTSGKLEEFMKEELPDNDYARRLAAMMMGMTGMIPFPSRQKEGVDMLPEKTEEVKPASAVEVPEDVMNAAYAGDLKAMMEILAREHKKRVPEAGSTSEKQNETDRAGGLSDQEKETLDRLIRIASENNVSVDWVVLRALNLYLKEYQKTGRL